MERNLEPKKKTKERRPRPLTPGTKEFYENLDDDIGEEYV